MTTTETTDVLVVLYVPASMAPEAGDRAVTLTRTRLAEYAGGTDEAVSVGAIQ